VHRVEESHEAYLFFQESGAPFDVPRDALSADQDGELRALLTEHGLLPARPR
jgi:hypothetical protein